MYLYDKNRITYFAETDRRNKRIPFGIKAEDRTRHMYIIGKTGMGKSTLIEQMAVQDIKNGEGFAFIDPHGKSAALLLDYIPPERIKDVVYFAPFDMENPIAFNVMEDVGPNKRHLVANGLMSAFKKIWGPETWSARMEYILMNALLALLEYPESTLLGVSRMLTDKVYRKKVVDNVKDPSVRAYWVDEFAKYSEQYAKEAVPGIQNKLGQFTSNPLIRNIIGQPHSSFDLRTMMDERKILIVNLSKGQMGEGNANLLGGMIITKIYLAAMSRADLTESELKKLPNFYMYVDEFQSFANESFADILSEARKYKLALIMAHQYIEQMDDKVRAAVFGNVGTQIMFRVGATDAEPLEKEYAPVFTAEDMVNLGFTQIYLKLMIDGVASHPFSAVSMPPVLPPEKSSREEVIVSSRELYAHSRQEVEKSISEWYGSGVVEDSPRAREEQTVEKEQRTPYVAMSPREGQGMRQSYPMRGDVVRPRPPYEGGALSRGEDSRARVLLGKSDLPSNTRAREPDNMSDKMPGKEVVPPAGKTAKPFAEAFKNIQKEASVPNRPFPSPATERRPFVAPNAPKGSLKSALADVLNAHKEKQPEAPKQETPKPEVPVVTRVEVATKPEEVKREEVKVPAQPIVEKQPVAVPPEEPKAHGGHGGAGQVREVPEDVLTAILQGED